MHSGECVRYQVPDIFTPLCRLWDITPTSGVAGTAEIVLDAVLEDVSSSFTLWLGVLLGAKDNGFGAVFTVDLIQSLVEAFHLLVAL